MAPEGSDPKGHYAALGLARDADAAAVKRAYRVRAKAVHPDHNPGADARQAFDRLTEAYRVLRDPALRARYDAGMPVDPDAPLEPVACSCCGRVTAQPRFLVFREVQGRFLRTRVVRRRGIFCRDCADHEIIRASTRTWVMGWWSPLGPLHALAALLSNLWGGTKPKAENARVLLHQARAFLTRGDLELAHSLALQARGFVTAEEERRQVEALLRAAGRGRRLHDRWRRLGHAFLVQALPLAALALVAAVGALIVAWRLEAGSAISEIRLRPVVPGETAHVASEVIKVRQAPSESSPVIALLDRFTTVEVTGSLPEGEWVRVRTPAGMTGFVSARLLFAGSGVEAKRRWCEDSGGAAPENGTVLTRRTGGAHSLLVRNPLPRDAVVTVRTQTGSSLVSMYVAAESEASLGGIPDGRFRILFATGSDYSRACRLFLDGMEAFILPTALTFRNGGEAQPLELAEPGDDTGRPRPIGLDFFLQD